MSKAHGTTAGKVAQARVLAAALLRERKAKAEAAERAERHEHAKLTIQAIADRRVSQDKAWSKFWASAPPEVRPLIRKTMSWRPILDAGGVPQARWVPADDGTWLVLVPSQQGRPAVGDTITVARRDGWAARHTVNMSLIRTPEFDIVNVGDPLGVVFRLED